AGHAGQGRPDRGDAPLRRGDRPAARRPHRRQRG
ncbi:hypothetical protein, partial [Kineosporia sp. R_H_3]